MYRLMFSNGNVQEYKSWGDLQTAAREFGGTPKCISGNDYAFVPNE